MTDYNEFLVSKDSPLIRNEVSPYGYASDTPGGAVGAYHIRDASITNAKIGTAAIGTANIGTLSFNEISGGTAVLGGTTNGDGLLRVKNSAGGTICTIDNTGITVNNGSISISNTAGSVSYDGAGIVSVQNFAYSGVVGAGLNQVISGTAAVPLTGGTLNFILTRPALFRAECLSILYSTESEGNTTYGYVDFQYVCNGTTYTADADETLLFPGNVNGRSYYNYYLGTLWAGTWSLITVGYLGGITGTPTMTVYQYKSQYSLLGK